MTVLEDLRVHRLSQISHSSMAEIQPCLMLFTAMKNSNHSQSYDHQTKKRIFNTVLFYEGALLHTHLVLQTTFVYTYPMTLSTNIP